MIEPKRATPTVNLSEAEIIPGVIFVAAEFLVKIILWGFYAVNLAFYYEHVPFMFDHSVHSAVLQGFQSRLGIVCI